MKCYMGKRYVMIRDSQLSPMTLVKALSAAKEETQRDGETVFVAELKTRVYQPPVVAQEIGDEDEDEDYENSIFGDVVNSFEDAEEK